MSLAAMQSVRLAKLFFQAVSFIIFAYQSILAVQKFSMANFIPSMETVDISEAKLPAIFICLKDTDILMSNFEEQGYWSHFRFRYGDVDNQAGSVSWEGNNSMPYKNLTSHVYSSAYKTYMAIAGNPSENWNFPGDGMSLGKGMSEIFTAFDGTCVRVEINATNNIPSGPFDVNIISFDNVQIFLADPKTSLFYKINTDSMTGDTIESEKGSEKSYLVDFEEIHWMEESGECTIYGEGAEFRSLADCVANEQEQIFKPLLGCQVPWLAAPDDPNICKGRVPLTYDEKQNFVSELRSVSTNIKKMMIADQFKSCLKPCQELKAHSKLRSNEQGEMMQMTVLSFQKRVKVTKYLKAYGLFDLVVEAGSSLGLWIGLSAIGVFDLLLHAGDVVIKKFRKMKEYHPRF